MTLRLTLVSSTPRLYARARDIRSHALPWARPSSRPFPGLLAQLRVPALGVETLPPHGAGLTYRVSVYWGDSLRARSDTYQDQSITRREKVGGRSRDVLDAVLASDGSVGMDGGAVLGFTPELTRGTDETLGTDRENLTVMRFAQSPPLPNTTLLGVLASLPNSRQKHSLPSSGIVAKAREQRALPFFTRVCLEEKHVPTEPDPLFDGVLRVAGRISTADDTDGPDGIWLSFSFPSVLLDMHKGLERGLSQGFLLQHCQFSPPRAGRPTRHRLLITAFVEKEKEEKGSFTVWRKQLIAAGCNS
ncbi:hypothetical protein CSOJ01_14059 [Colletotrichum sojae]|uniref:Uncharacterized protein n=1 Tax=Colletotrichum sojae TaxID=2175907 RepID=A0A8H6IQS6_9PEZI|nr:hypothetical protein CSOJ01_14059 [Colletotrichum sojae]